MSFHFKLFKIKMLHLIVRSLRMTDSACIRVLVLLKGCFEKVNVEEKLELQRDHRGD